MFTIRMKSARITRLLVEVAILVATGLIVWVTVRDLFSPTGMEHEALVALALILGISGWLIGRLYFWRRRTRLRRRAGIES
jgi:hypothetical protein